METPGGSEGRPGKYCTNWDKKEEQTKKKKTPGGRGGGANPPKEEVEETNEFYALASVIARGFCAAPYLLC